MSDTPRGVRNNNPGNIRLVPGVQWVGEVFGADPDFCTFTDPQHGIRAIAETLHSYWVRDGVNTIREAINRWAPPSENDTGAYVMDVATRAGVDPDQDVHLTDVVVPLVNAIIAHECSNYVYPANVVQAGVALAMPTASGTSS